MRKIQEHGIRALLDTDFISKLYYANTNESDRFIYRIIEIDSFIFMCHQQTVDELNLYNERIFDDLEKREKITVYTDYALIRLMSESFGSMAYGFYVNMLRRSCNIFSKIIFNKHLDILDEYITKKWGKYDLNEFVLLIKDFDEKVGISNNLGEIKLFTMAQVLDQLGEELYVFCSDDRRARYVLSNQTNMECVSALASFYLAKKYTGMSKEEAWKFFDSWVTNHKKHGQEYFQIYSSNGYRLEKIQGQVVFDMLYNDELYLMKDGFFRRKK